MREILDDLEKWQKQGKKIAIARVISVEGSGPRDAGASMAVNEEGKVSGSVSGGCVESVVVRECIGILKENKLFKKIEFKVSNESAWEVGLACGGEIAIYLEQVT